MVRLRVLHFASVLLFSAMMAGAPAQGAQPLETQRLERLMDQQDIERLISDYSWYLDAKDFDAYGALFADGVILNAKGAAIASGAQQVGAMARKYLGHDMGRFVRHIVSNVRIDVSPDGQQASATSFLTTLEGENEGAAYIFRIARYHDRFARVDGQWRFRARQELTDWVLRERVPVGGGAPAAMESGSKARH